MPSEDLKKKNDEFLELALPLDVAARKVLIPFLLLIVIIAALYQIPYPVVPLIALFVIFISASGLGLRLIRKYFLPAENIYFWILFTDSVLLAVTTYLTGGIESFAPILYILIMLLAGLVLPFRGAVGIVISCTFLYLSEIGLEIIGIIPHIGIFKEFFPQQQYATSAYIRIVPIAYAAGAMAMTYLAYTVSEVLRKRKASLEALNRELESKSKLMAQQSRDLDGRNRQLNEKLLEIETLQSSLEEKVKEKTAELQKKVDELEEFHDLTVGRELKMIELEKEIAALRPKPEKEAKS